MKRRFVLSTETLRNLTGPELANVRGGAPESGVGTCRPAPPKRPVTM